MKTQSILYFLRWTLYRFIEAVLVVFIYVALLALHCAI